MRTAWRILAVSLAVVPGVGASCEDPTGPVREVEEAARRWANAGPYAYAYTLHETCFCPPSGRRIVVVDDEVVRVERIVEHDPGRVLEGYTVEGLFGLIRQSLEREPDSHFLEFDPVLGYPTRVHFDYEHQAIDEEWGFQVEDFRPLPR